MKILIDALALAQPKGPEGLYWKTVLPQLLTCLREYEVFVLIRPGYKLKVNPTIHFLQAPAYDSQHPVIEDRRLAALCAELQIDVFLSTFYTTAGGKVRSVLVAPVIASDSSAARLSWPHLQNPTTEQIVRALVDDSPAVAETVGVQRAEENRLHMEAERLRRNSLEQAQKLWDQAMMPLSATKRAFKAIKSVHRYPEYFTRIWRWRAN